MGQNHSSNGQSQFEPLSMTLDKEMEKQIALKNIQFEQVQAFQKAQKAESFSWEFLSSATTMITLIYSAQKTGNKFLAVPIVPIVMFIGYRYDQCYGDNDDNIEKNANLLLETKRKLLTPFGGPITLAELDQRRAAWRNNQQTEAL